MLLLPLFWLACSTPAPSPQAPSALVPVPPTPTSAVYALARLPDTVVLELPATTRPGAQAPPDSFSPPVAFTRLRTAGDVAVWSTPLPVHANLFPSRQDGARTFGNFEPAGLSVAVDGKPLRFLRGGKGARTWGYDPDNLLIGLAADDPAPADVTITWAKATDAEAMLHLGTSGLAPKAFALRTLTVGTEAYTGLLLPAPASATWTLTLPEGAVLSLRGTILPPAISAAVTSDGASVSVIVAPEDGVPQVVGTSQLAVDGWSDLRVDLSAYGGQTVTVQLATDPGASSDLDLAFLEEPTIYVPSAHPRRVVVAFVDTVRRDHLGMYGYTLHPTTPKLDAWASSGTRLDDHRTVAPWTLPSARSALSGEQPEDWFEVPTLADHLAQAGFYTRGIVANAYLSQVFAMHRGFGHYSYLILQHADVTVDQALETLERWPDRDLFLYVQFMEAHLPYMEPKAYRNLFAGEQPKALAAITRTDLVKFHGDEPEFPPVRDYVFARYDQNLRVLDDEVSRLFTAVGDDAVTVLFADHGEELWDHRGFEHGHAFYDELLKVPMVVRGPGVPAGALDVPTSLLDLTPTVVELAGLPRLSGTAGTSLLPAMRGDAAARAALSARPQAFGRPLYGEDGWGVVSDGQKWWSREAREVVFGLAADPEERRDLAARADRSAFPEAVSEALGRPMVQVWRVTLQPRGESEPVTVTVAHPGGVTAAWNAYDPRGYHENIAPTVVDGSAQVVQPPRKRMSSVFYVQPKGAAAAGDGLTVTLSGGSGAGSWTGQVPAGKDDGRPQVVLDTSGAWKVHVDLAWVPVPGGTEVSGFAPELSEALKALGYMGDEDGGDDGDED